MLRYRVERTGTPRAYVVTVYDAAGYLLGWRVGADIVALRAWLAVEYPGAEPTEW